MNMKQGRRPRLFTLGHSDRTLNDFLRILEVSSIRFVADIRSNPASARFPHFERNALSKALEDRGLVYRWFRELGGRRPATKGEEEHDAFSDQGFRRYAAAMNTLDFTASVEELVGLAGSTVVAMICAEKDYHFCHRQLLSDRLQVLGARVVHILDFDDAQEHVLHEDLAVKQGRLIYKKRQLDLLSSTEAK